MNKSQSLRLFQTAMLLPVTVQIPAIAQAQEQKEERPNLLFIMADQWRGEALGCLGIEPVITPSLDSLANEGILFTNAISTYPVSSPARAMLMTGLNPTLNGVPWNCTSQSGCNLNDDAVCWSDVLHNEGYQTAYIGKWHLDAPYKPYIGTYNNDREPAWNEWTPKERRHGWDYWVAYGTYDYHLNPMYWRTDSARLQWHYTDFYRGKPCWGPEFEVDEAMSYLDDFQEKGEGSPFAMVISMNPPHTGYELVPDSFKAKYSNLDIEPDVARRKNVGEKGTPSGNYWRNNIKNYYACMTGVDYQVGRMIDYLKEKGLYENTLIIFTSDHGICMGAHDIQGKDVWYEEAMRIPLLMKLPHQKEARADSLMIAFQDLGPTLLGLMGLAVPESMQTIDHTPYILGESTEEPDYQPYYFVDYKDYTTGYRGMRGNRYTYVIHATTGKIDKELLYDRQNDPYQLTNIAASHPELCNMLKEKVRQYCIKTNDVFVKALE